MMKNRWMCKPMPRFWQAAIFLMVASACATGQSRRPESFWTTRTLTGKTFSGNYRTDVDWHGLIPPAGLGTVRLSRSPSNPDHVHFQLHVGSLRLEDQEASLSSYGGVLGKYQDTHGEWTFRFYEEEIFTLEREGYALVVTLELVSPDRVEVRKMKYEIGSGATARRHTGSSTGGRSKTMDFLYLGMIVLFVLSRG